MPRTFQLTLESPHPADLVLGAFRDEKYWRARLAAFDDTRPTLDAITTDADGVTSVAMTLRFGVEQLPAPLNRLHHGTLRVGHLESWWADDTGGAHGRITVEAPGTPMSGHGELSLTPHADGSRLTGTGTVDVRFPVVGGAIAGVIAGQLANGIRDIHRFTDAWLAEHGAA